MEARGATRRLQAAAGKREQHELRVERPYRACDRVRQPAILDGHVVERTVRLDVLEAHAFGRGDGRSAPTW